jgi:hypothetical protein
MSDSKQLTLEQLKETLIDFVNGIEAQCVKLKHDLGLAPEQLKYSWNPEKIKWESAQGTKGPYEKSEDVNNLEFKAMLKDLNAHKNFLHHDRWKYWVFKNGTTVARRKMA